MKTRTALTIALVLGAGTTAGILLRSAKPRLSAPPRMRQPPETEDHFADMIEEGDGLLAQLKAEAAAARKRARG
jgi:hypothetical protein